MANLQYIGARYVPKFYLNPDDNSNDWKSGVDYEALTIVTYNNDSYTSKKPVPDSAGTPDSEPDFWACTTKYTAAIQALQTSVGNIEEDIDAIKAAFITPQMLGAVGDGVHDDTQAFILLQNVSNNIFIPDGTYIINQSVTIQNVLVDEGNYVNYRPMYAKKLELKLDSFGYVKKNIPLYFSNSYEEAVCYIGGKYYVATNEYQTPYTSGIVVYDDNFNLLTHKTISGDASLGVACSCTTDGVYLYVDFDAGLHYKYNPSDLDNPILVVTNTDYTNTCYYNKQLYGVKTTSTRVTVGKLNASLTDLTDTWYFDRDSEVIQSATIFNGLVIVATTFGKFAVADLVTHAVEFVPYYNAPFEIESFFEKNGELYMSSHISGMNGIYSISKVNYGESESTYKFVEIDCNVIDFVPNIYATSRSSIYHVINGKTNGNRFPSDDCIVLWANKTIICYSITDNFMSYYTGSAWRRFGAFTNISTTIDGGMSLQLTANNVLRLSLGGYHLTDAHKTITTDFSAIYSALGLPNNQEFRTIITSRQNGVLPGANTDYYAVEFLIKKTSVEIWCNSLRGLTSVADAYLGGWAFVW